MAHEDSHSLKQMLNPYCVRGTVQSKQKNIKSKDTIPAKDYLKQKETCPLSYCTVLALLDTNYMPDHTAHQRRTTVTII